MLKIFSPKQHGIADYGFLAALFTIPRLLRVNKKAQTFYDVLGSNVIAINGTTDHGVGLVPLISVETHQKLDYANLALLYGMFASPTIRNDKMALAFHSAFTALATFNVLLTDYNAVRNADGEYEK